MLDKLKTSLIRSLEYYKELLFSPLETLTRIDGKPLEYHFIPLVTLNIFAVVIGFARSSFSFNTLYLNVRYAFAICGATLLIFFLLKQAFKTSYFSDTTTNIKKYLIELFIKTVVILTMVNTLFGITWSGGYYRRTDWLTNFIVVFGIYFSILYGQNILNEKNRKLVISLSLAISFQVIVFLQLLPFSSSFSTIQTRLEFEEIEYLVEAKKLTENEVVAHWLAIYGEQTYLMVIDPDSSVELVQNIGAIYNTSIFCVNYLAKRGSAKLLRQMKEKILNSEEKIDRYIDVQKRLSGHMYDLPNYDTGKIICSQKF